MNTINEIKKGQSVVLTTEIEKGEFETLRSAESADTTVSLKRKLGKDFYFQSKINPHKIAFGSHIIVTCNGHELMCVFDEGVIHDEEHIIKHDVFNAKFFSLQTIYHTLPPEDDS